MIHIRWVALILLAAACVPAPRPPDCPVCPPPKPAPESVRYDTKTFADLPGWSRAELEPGLRAFLGGCARFKRVCDIARAVPPGDEPAARKFFETEFMPYAVVSTTSGDSGVITGYYEPVIDGSRTPTAVHRFPIYGVPSDLVVVDLPEAKQLRLRGRLEGRRLIPYYSRAEIDARADF